MATGLLPGYDANKGTNNLSRQCALQPSWNYSSSPFFGVSLHSQVADCNVLNLQIEFDAARKVSPQGHCVQTLMG